MSNVETLIGSLGFPIAVTIYLLYERSKVMEKLTEAINNNTLVIKELCGLVKVEKND